MWLKVPSATAMKSKHSGQDNIDAAYRCKLPSTSRELSLLKEAVREYGINLENVLDVGCGVGHAVETLADLGARGFGIDLNEEVILYLRRNMTSGNFKFFNQDFLTFDTQQPLTLITMLAVLEHIEDDRSFLRKAFQLLDEGGYLIIVVPAHSRYYCKHDRLYGHYRRYDRGPLKELLQQQGFEVVRIYTYGLQLLQAINSMFIREKRIDAIQKATVQSSFELPGWYVRLYPVLKFGLYPYNMCQELIKNTDAGNAYFVIGRKTINTGRQV